MMHGYPTGAAALLATDHGWGDLDEECSRLVDFHVGRG